MPSSSPLPGQMSDFKLKLSYWYVTHKLLMKKGLIAFLIILNVGLFGYSLFRAVVLFVIQGPEYRAAINQLPTNLVDYPTLREQQGPQPLEQLLFDTVPTADGRYDFVLKLANPNEQHVAEAVSVELLSNGEVLEQKTTFVYPQSSNYVLFFNQAVSPDAVQLRIADVAWRRVFNFKALAEPRLQFEISDVEFIPAGQAGFGNQFTASTLQFNITNASAYSYWQVGLAMVLLGGQGISGVNYLALDQFRSGETRPIEMRWLSPLPPVTDTDIMPIVNILDSSVYMPLE